MISASSRAFSTGSSSQNGFCGSAVAHSSDVYPSAYIQSDSDLSNLIGGNSSQRLVGSCEGGDKGELDWSAGLPVILYIFLNICNNQALAMRGFVLCLCFNVQLFFLFYFKKSQRIKFIMFKLGSGRAYFRIVLTTGYTPLFTLHGANVQASCSLNIDHKMAPCHCKTKTRFSRLWRNVRVKTGSAKLICQVSLVNNKHVYLKTCFLNIFST